MADEADLIEAFRNGDDFAFVSLYNRYKASIYGFAARMLMDRDAAQDVMQETFLRIYEKRQMLLNVQAFRAWLFAIARNQCLNMLRKGTRTVPLDEAFAAQLPLPEGKPLEKAEQVALVKYHLACLQPQYREVLILREFQNLSYAEIAAATRSTLSAVKSRLFKARRKVGGKHFTRAAARSRAPRGGNIMTTSPCTHEESVHLFLDGELSNDALPDFFGHLTTCAGCRHLMNAMMDFRRMSRHHVVHVPPQADEAVLARLEELKHRRSPRDRYYERRPLWQTRASLSLRTCAILALLFFVSGIKVAYDTSIARSLSLLEESAPEYWTASAPFGVQYVMHPGLLVEATRLPDAEERP